MDERLPDLALEDSPSSTPSLSGRSIDRAGVGCDCKFNPLALGQIQNGADMSRRGRGPHAQKECRSTAPRANWKGYLRFSLVSCPILLYPATSDAEKVRFNQINKKTGHRIKMQKVDAETGDVVDSDEIVKGYKLKSKLVLGSAPASTGCGRCATGRPAGAIFLATTRQRRPPIRRV
jgi:hypothetical protein